MKAKAVFHGPNSCVYHFLDIAKVTRFIALSILVVFSSTAYSQELLLEYKNRTESVSTPVIEGQIRLRNFTSDSVDLRAYRIRYFLDADGLSPLVNLKIVKPAQLAANTTGVFLAAEGYVEFSFESDFVLELLPGQTIMIRYEIEAADSSEFDQSNDISFVQDQDSFGANPDILLVSSGVNDDGDDSDDQSEVPDAVSLADIDLLYRNRESKLLSNSIEGQIRTLNNSSNAINLENLEVRYFMSRDGINPSLRLKASSPAGIVDAENSVFVPDQGNSDSGYYKFVFNQNVKSVLNPGEQLTFRFELEANGDEEFNQGNDLSFRQFQDKYAANEDIHVLSSDGESGGESPDLGNDDGEIDPTPIFSELGVTPYPLVPGHIQSPIFSVSVNDIDIPVEELYGNLDIVPDANSKNHKLAVARTSFDFSQFGSANITVAIPGNINTSVISPLNAEAFGLSDNGSGYSSLRMENRALSFSVGAPSQFVIEINEYEYLLVFVDDVETDRPDPSNANVVRLSDFLPNNRNPESDVTVPFQNAIDSAANEGKILFVDDGKYMTGQLKFGAGSQMYLSSGALVKAISDFDRDIWPDELPANATNDDSSFISIGSDLAITNDRTYLQTSNVRIYGRGVIDGNGWDLRMQNDSSSLVANVKLVRVVNSTNVLIEDLYFRDSARWSFHLLGSSNVDLRRIKLFNNMVGFTQILEGNPTRVIHKPYVSNIDGVDIDGSVDVSITDSFIMTSDDAFAVKTNDYLTNNMATTDVLIRGNRIWTHKAALKIGPELDNDVRRVDFSDNLVIRADRLLSIQTGNVSGNTVEDVTLSDNRTEFIGGNNKQRFFRFKAVARSRINNIAVENHSAAVPSVEFSSSEGLNSQWNITNFTVNNFRIGGNVVGIGSVFDEINSTGSYRQFEYTDLTWNGLLISQ